MTKRSVLGAELENQDSRPEGLCRIRISPPGSHRMKIEESVSSFSALHKNLMLTVQWHNEVHWFLIPYELPTTICRGYGNVDIVTRNLFSLSLELMRQPFGSASSLQTGPKIV